MQVRIHSMLIIIISILVCSGCKTTQKAWTADSWQKTSLMTVGGAGAGAAIGHQARGKIKHAEIIGAGVGAATGFIVNQTYKKDFDKGVAYGEEMGRNQAKVDLLEKIRDMEMEGKRYLDLKQNNNTKKYYIERGEQEELF